MMILNESAASDVFKLVFVYTHMFIDSVDKV